MWNSTDPREQFFNTYSYCGGDPANYIDPNGENAVLGGMLIGLVAGAITGAVIAEATGNEWWQGALIGGATGAIVGLGIGSMADWGLNPGGWASNQQLLDIGAELYGPISPEMGTKSIGQLNPIKAVTELPVPMMSGVTADEMWQSFINNFVSNRVETIMELMLDLPGYGNGPYTGYNGTPQGYGQGPWTSNTNYLSSCRNDCSFRVGMSTSSGPNVTSANADKYFGSRVPQDQSQLQVVNWRGAHMGMTQNNIVYEMTSQGLRYGERNVQQVTNIINQNRSTPINPVFYSLW